VRNLACIGFCKDNRRSSTHSPWPNWDEPLLPAVLFLR
jgi:hypothetical protein